MSEKLREERRKNSEKLIEKSKERAAKKTEELQEALEEKRTDKGEKKTGRAEEIIKEKMDAARDGVAYMDDSDFKTIMEAIREDKDNKTDNQKQTQHGTVLDLWI